MLMWGRALLKYGGFIILLSFKKLRIRINTLWSQILGAKVYNREGNSPEYLIRASIVNLVKRRFKNKDSPKVGLEAAIFLRKRNSSFTEFFCVIDVTRLKLTPELVFIN